ncbi:MAG: DUF4126 family protein [Gaiellales bacterium]|nr:MAG: DUF4126 family protein [Gaiellales bacterium]
METALIWAIGAGVGLASLAGNRAFAPLAVFILMARMDWLPWFGVEESPLDFIFSDVAVVILLLLVVLEVIMTRLTLLMLVERLLRLPFALVSGALLCGAAVAHEAPGWGYIAGIAGGALLAALGYYVHSGIVIAGEGRDPGPALDLAVLVLAATILLLPQAGYAYLLAIFWLSIRVRRLKRLKYKGLRVLA